jgi:hypothetical protein
MQTDLVAADLTAVNQLRQASLWPARWFFGYEAWASRIVRADFIDRSSIPEETLYMGFPVTLKSELGFGAFLSIEVPS